MKALLQRVLKAEVTVDGNVISSTGLGLIVFLGVERGDEEKDADYLLDKIINLRIFEDEQGKMNLSLLDIKGDLMVISQFTLTADCRKGRRPSFTDAEEPVRAEAIYSYFTKKARMKISKVETGKFGALMMIDVTHHGPVTIMLDSRK
ncbi:MAG TPA: D-aminoacyl-tRNA deacylase [Syntrophales bacterium]|nr:D-aminoacyl-tRNA deacylase [Syntrophales bacterium]HOL58522.1 D-aminoacyl-tRNA deacylase [Syntrophales bacterium]